MAITIPTQIRSVDPYADHRFSNTINRFNRIFTAGLDTIMPFDDQEFTLTKMTSGGTATPGGSGYPTYTWNANKAVKIGPGLCIKDDTLIHIRHDAYLDFEDTDNYVGTDVGFNQFNATGKYFILLHYVYSRSIPAPQATYVIAKQRLEFLNNRDKYIYLGTANVISSAGYSIDTIDLTDIDESINNDVISRPNYKFVLPLVDGGEIV
jgi:hypothetical protein